MVKKMLTKLSKFNLKKKNGFLNNIFQKINDS